MTIQQMYNELIHYVNCDLHEKSDAEIIEMYNRLFKED